VVLVLTILIGLLAGWEFERRRIALLLPALICGLFQAGHIALSVATHKPADITLLPVIMGVLWLAATWMGATVHSARAVH
jgi:hypothetical protein